MYVLSKYVCFCIHTFFVADFYFRVSTHNWKLLLMGDFIINDYCALRVLCLADCLFRFSILLPFDLRPSLDGLGCDLSSTSTCYMNSLLLVSESRSWNIKRKTLSCLQKGQSCVFTSFFSVLYLDVLSVKRIVCFVSLYDRCSTDKCHSHFFMTAILIDTLM